MILISILLYSIICFYCVNAKEVINILINKPDIGANEYLGKYNEMISQYLSMNNINDYDVKYSYCTPVSTDGENLSQIYKNAGSPFSIDVGYAKNFNCTLRELKNSNYDMIILDDRFLYADNSYADFILLQDEFDFKKFSDYYADYNNYRINTEDISYHDEDILNDGKIGNKKNLYGLPYEFDFDLLYYHSVNDKSKDSLSLKVKDSSLENNNSFEEILSAGFKDNDDLINFFGEFVSYQYNKPIENDMLSYNFLYNEESTELFHSFRNYILKFTGSNIEKTLSTSLEDAYTSFLNNENKLFRGKASLYKNLKENPNITIKINSLPENISVINEKYLVINKNSLKSTDTLVKIALLLTSKEMQIYRSMQIGSIPTFNFRDPSDESVVSYCKINMDMCDLLKKLSPIRIRNIFKKNKFSAHYLETRLILPSELKKTLIDPNDNAAQKLFMNILDIWNYASDKDFEVDSNTIIFLILNIITILVAILLFILMIIVYRNRAHPYIKAMSPQITNLTIFGIQMRIINPYFYGIVKTRFLCRLSVVLNFFVNNLVYIPLFAIIFRIYYIYNNATNISYGKKLNDKRLIIYILIVIILTFFGYYGISYFNYFNLVTDGSLQYYRFLTCIYDFNQHSLISIIYTSILFIVMITLTIKIHKLSKKYGDIIFIHFIVFLLFSSFIFDIAFNSFLSNGSSINLSSMILMYIHIIISIVTLYFLIGKRLLYIKRHPIKNKEKFLKNDFSIVNNLAKFIAMKKDDSRFSCFDSSSKSQNRNSINSNNLNNGNIDNVDDIDDNDESNINNKNYRYLTQSLKLYDSNEINISNIIFE